MSKDFFGEEEEDKILNDEEELFTLTDEDGNEIERHEGFIGKKALVEKLSSLGVE